MNGEIVEAIWHDGRRFLAKVNDYGVAVIFAPVPEHRDEAFDEPGTSPKGEDRRLT